MQFPPITVCVGDPERWFSPFGGCEIYTDASNRKFCLIDTAQNGDVAAYQVCRQCGMCVSSVQPPAIPPSFPSPPLLPPSIHTHTLNDDSNLSLILVATLVPSLFCFLGLLYGYWLHRRKRNTAASTLEVVRSRVTSA